MAVPFSTPIVFLIYKRPALAARVFALIRQIQPTTLLVVADGPKRNEDAAACAKTRAVIDQVDWDCRVLRHYSETNLGCAQRVSSGLDWAFGQVDTAIVLEDDCVPDASFFPFCQILLQRYRDDQRIMAIAGSNYQFGRRRTHDSYYFSRYNHCWGWATWRRAWQHFDFEMRLWPTVRDQDWLYDMLQSRAASRVWATAFQRTYDGVYDSWAYRWTLSCWLQSGLSILPNVNLVSNVGFEGAGTHNRRRNIMADMATQSLTLPLQHPPYVIRDARADDFTQNILFSTQFIHRVRRKFGLFV
ncbi:MAG: glycosyltransferase family 2 protein [Cyanobacteria bacterium J06632_22]